MLQLIATHKAGQRLYYLTEKGVIIIRRPYDDKPDKVVDLSHILLDYYPCERPGIAVSMLRVKRYVVDNWQQAPRAKRPTGKPGVRWGRYEFL